MEREIVLSTSAPEEVVVHQFINIRKHLTGKNYTRVFNEDFSQLAKDKSLNLTDLRVLIGLFRFLDYDNLIDVTQTQLAKELDLHQPEVSKAIKKLESKGVIEKLTGKGRQNVYRLNPFIGFKGQAKNLKKLQEGNFPPEVFTATTSKGDSTTLGSEV